MRAIFIGSFCALGAMTADLAVYRAIINEPAMAIFMAFMCVVNFAMATFVWER